MRELDAQLGRVNASLTEALSKTAVCAVLYSKLPDSVLAFLNPNYALAVLQQMLEPLAESERLVDTWLRIFVTAQAHQQQQSR